MNKGEDGGEDDEHPEIIPVDPAQIGEVQEDNPAIAHIPVLELPQHTHQPYSTGTITNHYHPPLS